MAAHARRPVAAAPPPRDDSRAYDRDLNLGPLRPTTTHPTPTPTPRLKATADALSAPGKGFLASDESAGPWLRAGHSEAKKIPDTEVNKLHSAQTV